MSKQALQGTRLNAFAMLPSDLTYITDKNHPLYDRRVERPITEEFIANIDRFGVKTPVLVQKDGSKTMIVFGRRRKRAGDVVNERRKARGEPLLRIPCMVFRGDEREAFAVSILENEHREADDPITRADKCKRLLDMGYSEDEAGLIFGLKKTAVRNLLSLMDLDSSVKARVQKGELSASAVLPLTALSRDEQKTKVAELVESGQTSRAKVERALERPGGTRPTGRMTSVSKARVRRLVAVNEREKVLDSKAALVLLWVLGDASDEDMGEVKGWDALLKAETARPEKAEATT